MGRRDAEQVVSKMAQYENFFVSLMVAEELGLQVTDDDDTVLLTDAFVMFASFACIGSIPISLYCLGPIGIMQEHDLFILTASLSLITLCLLGVIKSTFCMASPWYSAFEALVHGLVCAGFSYAVGASVLAFFD